MTIAKWTKCVNVRSAIENKMETKLTVLSIFETLLLWNLSQVVFLAL